MPIVHRDSQKSQDITMSSLILSGVSRQTCKLRKETAKSNDQVPGLPDFIPNSRNRLLRLFAVIVSSQPIGECSRSRRWQPTVSKMQRLRREQHRDMLLFRVPEFSVRILFKSSPTLEDFKGSSQCFDRQTASARCARFDPQTRDVFKAMS